MKQFDQLLPPQSRFIQDSILSDYPYQMNKGAADSQKYE